LPRLYSKHKPSSCDIVRSDGHGQVTATLRRPERGLEATYIVVKAHVFYAWPLVRVVAALAHTDPYAFLEVIEELQHRVQITEHKCGYGIGT